MSGKRSRATYEADLQAQQSPFVFFGTPLPPLDPDVRDDGTYLPVWKQEVRDERGRRRLHGAFTGGWSAGYFNTVGSKEGWTPSTFVSSRSNRRKDDQKSAQQRPEDFMDDEDLADAEEARKIQTSQGFAGLGLTENDARRATGLAGLFRVEGDTMGTKLLKRMGWREGQGIGPKVRRAAELGMQSADPNVKTYLFAPEDVSMVSFVRKTDRKGLGYQGHARLSPIDAPSKEDRAGESDEDEDEISTVTARQPLHFTHKGGRKDKKPRGGIGIGILNDTGSDDDDPYEIGPRISYNRVIGGNKKKKKKESGSGATNPSLKSKPVFLPKSSLARVAQGVRKCHDGRLPLDGFIWGKESDPLASEVISGGKYPPPEMPPGWKSSKTATEATGVTPYTSTADAAKASTLDAKARAAALGEAQLPGKSVFDFISSAARDRLVHATGRTDLPQGLGEVPAEFALSESDKLQELLSNVPKVDKETAVAAISRGINIGGPYADNEAKASRYRAYLEHQAGLDSPLPRKPSGMSNDDWLQEFHEFFNCARIFKPMTGFMASRFTTSTSSSTSKLSSGSSGQGDGKNLINKPAPKPSDPAEEAAKLGMYGPMTRSVADFFPTRLLCKRFGVKPPANLQADEDMGSNDTTKAGTAYNAAREAYGSSRGGQTLQPLLAITAGPATPSVGRDATATQGLDQPAAVALPDKRNETVDASRNEALEGKRAGEEVFKAIFGDSSDEEEDKLDDQTATLSDSQNAGTGQPTSAGQRRAEAEEPAPIDERTTIPFTQEVNHFLKAVPAAERQRSPPPQYPASETSEASTSFRPGPPPFSALFASSLESNPDPAGVLEPFKPLASDACASPVAAAPAYATIASSSSEPSSSIQEETKRALPPDHKPEGEGSKSKDDEAEPPPAYSEGSSPLHSFTYVMAAAGGASSIITQVQQGGPPINAIGDVGADETITMDLRGTRFVLSRDELLTLPEFVLLSLFPNGLFPEGHMGGFAEGDAVQVDYDPASLQYMLDFFRSVAQSIPTESSPSASQDGDAVDALGGANREESKRAGIIVLREDLDFYAIPPKADISQAEMIEVKRAAAKALLKQNGIFSGLKRSDEPGTTEAHLIEMLTAGGFNHDDSWGHRAGEPNKAVVCSLALARLRSDIRGNDMGNNAVGMAQKLLLFWRKPARRCWWEGVELEDVEGVEGKLKVWIRRVWTLEMSVIGLR